MATYGFFNASTPCGDRDDDGSARERIGFQRIGIVGSAACGGGRGPDAAAVTFDDAARERQRETESAALVVERPGLAVVCLLYAPFVGHDQDSSRFPVDGDAPAFGDDGHGAGFFAQNCPENRVERGPEAYDVAGNVGAARWADQLEVHVAITTFMHELG